MAAGAVIFIIGFLGCCGAATENQCMLGTVRLSLASWGFFFFFLHFEDLGNILDFILKCNVLGLIIPCIHKSSLQKAFLKSIKWEKYTIDCKLLYIFLEAFCFPRHLMSVIIEENCH